MLITRKLIIEVLGAVKSICKSQQHCGVDCPFYTDSMCNIKNFAPEQWQLNADLDTHWKAFK